MFPHSDSIYQPFLCFSNKMSKYIFFDELSRFRPVLIKKFSNRQLKHQWVEVNFYCFCVKFKISRNFCLSSVCIFILRVAAYFYIFL